MLNYFSRVVQYMLYSKFYGAFGFKSYVQSPLKIDGPKNIFIGKKVVVAYKSWLAAVPLTGAKECKLVLQDGVTIGHFNHIYATKSIILERDVLTADRVYISDNLHGYSNVDLPVKNQPIKQQGDVVIGEGSWIGENVCIIGAKIGKHCVVGANSVVTKSIPDYSVVIGAPAYIIKRYDAELKKWRKTTPSGEFLNSAN